MKIVGKHKDYYDGGAQFGYDENVTFVRNINYIEEFRANHTNENWRAIFNNNIDLPSFNINPGEGRNTNNKYINYNPLFIWFAGSLILCYEIKEYTLNNLPIPTYDLKRYYVYGDEMIFKITELEKAHRVKLNDDFRYHINNLMKNIKIKNGFEIAKHFNTAYFLVYDFRNYDKNGIIVPTPSLKDIHFFNEVDYIQAWQRIESFLPTLKVDPVSEMNDEQKLNSHGMDDTSFRCQAPGNKKEKRRKNKERKKLKK